MSKEKEGSGGSSGSSLYKTRMCKVIVVFSFFLYLTPSQFFANGYCKQGNKCSFAHGENELQGGGEHGGKGGRRNKKQAEPFVLPERPALEKPDYNAGLTEAEIKELKETEGARVEKQKKFIANFLEVKECFVHWKLS